MIRTLIVDDEALSRQRIRRLLQEFPVIELAGECNNGRDAVQSIRREQPDLVFLDIQMKDMTGFDVLEQLGDDLPLIIFITAYDQYALRAFDFFAFDYLLKPFKDERFARSVQRALEQLSGPRDDAPLRELLQYLQTAPPPVPRLLPVKSADKIEFVEPADVRYILGAGYYIELYCVEKRHLLRMPLGQMLDQLDPLHFLRIHRSAIINLRFLDSIQHLGLGELEVVMKDGKTLRVSRSYKGDLLERLGVG